MRRATRSPCWTASRRRFTRGSGNLCRRCSGRFGTRSDSYTDRFATRASLRRCIAGQEAIVHLAAETGTGQSMYEIRRYAEVNVGGTACCWIGSANTRTPCAGWWSLHRAQSMERASTRPTRERSCIRTPGGQRIWRQAVSNPSARRPVRPLRLLATDEASGIHPSSVYGITKQNQEQMVMTVCPTMGIEAVGLRYQNVYGPGQSLKNPYTGILSISLPASSTEIP